MKDRKKYNSEKASATLIVFITVFFILIILGTILTTAYFKRRNQLVDIMDLQDAYDGDLEEAYKDRLDYIGKYVDYEPDSKTYSKNLLGINYTGSSSNTEDFKTGDYQDGWRILDYDKTTGEMTIVMEQMTKPLYLYGARGYNNGVNVLNDICKALYSKSEWNATARSIKIEDIEDRLNKTGIDTRNEYVSDGLQYNSKKTYDEQNKGPFTMNRNYPILYEKEKGSGTEGNGIAKETGLGKSAENPNKNNNASEVQFKQATNKLTVTKTYYCLVWDKRQFKHEGYYDIMTNVSNSSMYWVASRYVDCATNCGYFGIHRANDSYVGGHHLAVSHQGVDYAGSSNNCENVRAVVELGPGIKVDTSTSGLDQAHQYHISK